jgi:hypothetical protein
MQMMCRTRPGTTKAQYPATVPTSHQIPGPICPLYICPAPGITRLRTAAVPGFQLCWSGIRLWRICGSKNSPQCLHFLAEKATSSEQYGHRTLGSEVAVGLAGLAILHPSRLPARPHEFRWSNVSRCSVCPLLVRGPDTLEVSSLSGEVPEIEWKNPDQQHFYIVDQALVLDHVPTEAIPGVSSPVALICGPEPLPDIPLANVDRCGTLVEDVDTLPASATSWHVLDVFRVSCPHLTELFDQFQRILCPAERDCSIASSSS